MLAACKLPNIFAEEFELVDFNTCISLAKTNSPEHAGVLIDFAFGFVSQISVVFGLYFSGEAWMINMLLRLAIWTAILLYFSTCSGGANDAFDH
ncbi:hypothetical protein GEMRC1_011371 [Eukaryota sp. GEM-RC1]